MTRTLLFRRALAANVSSLLQKPKDESFVITKVMLVDALRLCFSSCSQFAKYAMPLFLEKLQSDVEAAQLETMLTLAACVRQLYDPNDYADLLEPLLNTLYDILTKCSDAAIEEAAIASIEAIALSLSTSVQLHTNSKQASDKILLPSIESFTDKVYTRQVQINAQTAYA